FTPPSGMISRYGLIGFASSLDTVGTLTRSVRDAALLLSAIAGKDPMDASSLAEPRRDSTQGLGGAGAGLRATGARVGWASLPHAECAISAYCLMAPSEASSNLARYDGVRYGLRVD